MSPTIRIIRVKRLDNDDALLLRVTQASQARPLDLKLVATDHEHIYHNNLKGADVAKQKADQFSGSNDDLKDILVYTFMRTRPDGASADLFKGVEIVSKLKKDDIEVTVRKNISGITQPVFTTTLIQDDEREEISPFEWVDTSVAITDELRDELHTSHSKLAAQQDEIVKLKAELDEFVKAKRLHDDDMLQKFAALLNTKKARIRQLRSQLEHANIAVDDDMQEAEEANEQPASRSKARKRQAPQDEDVEMEDEQDEDPAQTDDEKDLEDEEAAQNGSFRDLPPQRELPFATRTNQQSTPPVTRSQAAEEDDDATDDEL